MKRGRERSDEEATAQDLSLDETHDRLYILHWMEVLGESLGELDRLRSPRSDAVVEKSFVKARPHEAQAFTTGDASQHCTIIPGYH
jgi:hypothetical protein